MAKTQNKNHIHEIMILFKNKVNLYNCKSPTPMGSQRVTIPVSKLEGVLEDGLWFDGSSIEGFTRILKAICI